MTIDLDAKLLEELRSKKIFKIVKGKQVEMTLEEKINDAVLEYVRNYDSIETMIEEEFKATQLAETENEEDKDHENRGCC